MWWSDFSANFAADLVAGILFLLLGSIYLPNYLEYRKRPNLRTIVTPDLVKNQNNTYAGNLQVVIENSGKHQISNFYWHLYIPSDINVHFSLGDGVPNFENKDGWKHFSGFQKTPIYSKRLLTLGGLNINDASSNEFDMYSFFATEYGTDPHNYVVSMEVTQLKKVERKI